MLINRGELCSLNTSKLAVWHAMLLLDPRLPILSRATDVYTWTIKRRLWSFKNFLKIACKEKLINGAKWHSGSTVYWRKTYWLLRRINVVLMMNRILSKITRKAIQPQKPILKTTLVICWIFTSDQKRVNVHCKFDLQFICHCNSPYERSRTVFMKSKSV